MTHNTEKKTTTTYLIIALLIITAATVVFFMTKSNENHGKIPLPSGSQELMVIPTTSTQGGGATPQNI